MKRAVIVHAKRTPIGKAGGILKGLEVHELAAPLIRHLAGGAKVPIRDVILGNVVGPGGNVARLASLEAGTPLAVPGMTIDRQCSAGLESIRLACHLIQGGAGDAYVAGGAESVSTSPFPRRARFSPDELGDPDMPEAAELVAERFFITKEAQDEYALLSFERSWSAHENGMNHKEILPLPDVDTDEGLNKKRNLPALLKRARPLVKPGGTVTVANSCGIHDGAAAVLVMEESLARKKGLEPVLRFVDSEVVGVHPHFPGAGPIPAIKGILERNQLTMEDIDLVEINEAFASKIVACATELSIPYEKLNVSGGALTIGHPYGASGSIMVTRLFYEVQRRKGVRFVLAAIGSGGGIGLAVLFEVV
ncbi:acetyl-CoA C-acyltransferase [Rossellomorea marisflavi]|uniref:acetyl-CoA C-acyltransferase n=1 Tax=Rossellomorea marisflavi TaxID=189381 RepID=UPI002079802C|nr:acetyl-CoA C-acyltransferase [Rossellomorea marisflavi]USK92130.1 acetyl-CoA C-acyltransferase [Rossellomorea marisflavi]